MFITIVSLMAIIAYFMIGIFVLIVFRKLGISAFPNLTEDPTEPDEFIKKLIIGMWWVCIISWIVSTIMQRLIRVADLIDRTL